ncbi:AAA domain-containing protein, partial [Mycoplasma marinum]
MDIKENEIHQIGDFWFLVKTTPFFEIRNTNMLISKFEEQNFSNIDSLLLGDKKISELEDVKHDNAREDSTLDEFQNKALINAINSKHLSIIKGPPGTGKTHTISRIIKQYWNMGQKVIFASALHSSLDSLIYKINESKDMSDMKVWRSSMKPKSILPKNNSTQFEESDLFVTTFSSYIFNALHKGDSDFILIIDEASANNLFNVFSKTEFAKKVIIVGDNSQLYPIYNDEYK